MIAGPRPPPSPPGSAPGSPAPAPHSPFLTWRDMQHLVVRASKPAHLQAEDWRTNGVGRQGAAGPGGGGDPGPAGRVTAALPRSEPSLRLRAAGRRAAGGHRPHLAAHPAAEEVCRPGPEPPHVRPPACPSAITAGGVGDRAEASVYPSVKRGLDPVTSEPRPRLLAAPPPPSRLQEGPHPSTPPAPSCR